MEDSAKTIVKKLIASGHQAYFVGGCVRDKIMGREPKDYDIVTSAKPDQIKACFRGFQIVEVGESFGIVVVVVNNEPFEIATFRQDGASSDSRHPDEVKFVKTIEEDLSRRDLTMNAIATTDFKTFVDPFGGRDDIKNGVIRFVGDPAERLAEDNLRALRAIRFQAQLGLDINEDVMKALDGAELNVSAERISAELKKILLGDHAPQAIDSMRKCGMLWVIFPELKDLLSPHNSRWHQEADETGNTIWAHVRMVFNYAVTLSDECDKDLKLKIRLAALLHDVGKPGSRQPKDDGSDRFLGHDKLGAEMSKKILTRLRFESNIINDVAELVAMHMDVHEITKIKKDYKARLMLGRRLIDAALILGEADQKATVNAPDLKNTDGSHGDLQASAKFWREKYPVMLPEKILTGDDLIKGGAKPGPFFKKALDDSYQLQLGGEERKEVLLKNALGVIKREKDKAKEN